MEGLKAISRLASMARQMIIRPEDKIFRGQHIKTPFYAQRHCRYPARAILLRPFHSQSRRLRRAFRPKACQHFLFPKRLFYGRSNECIPIPKIRHDTMQGRFVPLAPPATYSQRPWAPEAPAKLQSCADPDSKSYRILVNPGSFLSVF